MVNQIESTVALKAMIIQ